MENIFTYQCCTLEQRWSCVRLEGSQSGRALEEEGTDRGENSWIPEREKTKKREAQVGWICDGQCGGGGARKEIWARQARRKDLAEPGMGRVQLIDLAGLQWLEWCLQQKGFVLWPCRPGRGPGAFGGQGDTREN